VGRELEEDGFLGFFEVVIDSSVVGVAKPDPKIFDFFFEAFPGVERQECLYVGDSMTWDVPAARLAGLVPCHLDRLGIYGEATDGLVRIRSLDAISAVVGAQPS
jgi:putative hydrolase of the HAD superfamily